MHFITCDFCGKIKKTNKRIILCSKCKTKCYHKIENREYNYNSDIREIPPNDNGKIYKVNNEVNVYVELMKTAIIKDYKMKHKYKLIKEEEEDE